VPPHVLHPVAITFFDQLDADIERLRRVHIENPQAFPRAVWNLYVDSAPIISHAAVAILSVCGSEAAVERTFSAQGLVHTDLRNRLGNATVEAEMFIKFNHRTLMRVEGRLPRVHRKRPGEGCAEMGEDYVEDEAPPNIAGVFNSPVVAGTEEKGDETDSTEERKGELRAAVVIRVPRPPAADDVQAFIEHIVAEMGVTAKYRWSDYRMQMLNTAGQAWKPPMRDTDDVLKKKIMTWVRAQEDEEGARVTVEL